MNMSKDDTAPLPASVAELVASYNARTLPAQLMTKPCLSWEEFWGAVLGLPDSTAEALARSEPMPPFFLLGRRRYIRTADAKAWLDKVAQRFPYTPRRNNRRSTVLD